MRFDVKIQVKVSHTRKFTIFWGEGGGWVIHTSLYFFTDSCFI